MAQGKFTVSVAADIREAAAYLKNYQRKKLPNIVQQSLNKAVTGLRTDAKNVISDKYLGLTKARIFAGTRTNFAHANNGVASLIFKKERVHSIASFKVTRKPRKISSGKKRLSGTGLNARVWEKKQDYKGAFLWVRPNAVGGESVTAFKRSSNSTKIIPTRRTGGTGEFRRYKTGENKGKLIRRQPIEVVFGTSVVQEINRNSTKGGTGIRDKLLELGKVRFIKELNRRLALLK